MSDPLGIPILNSWDPVYPIVSVAGLGWWLSGRFKRVTDQVITWLQAHEKDDAERHLENLRRFERIHIALARMGNGSLDKYKEEDHQ